VGPQHNPNLYAADLAKLVRFADDDNSPFAWTDASKTQHSALALALRSGTVYQGPPVAIAVGQPDATEQNALLEPIKPHTHTTPPTLTNFVDPSVYVGKPYASDIQVYLQDDYVLGEANGTIRATIHWDRPWKSSSPGSFDPAEHVHVVDGGSTAAPGLVVLQGSSTDYATRRQAPLSGSRRTSTGSIPLASSISSATCIGPIRCCSCRRRHRPRLPARMSRPQRSPSSCCTSTARP